MRPHPWGSAALRGHALAHFSHAPFTIVSTAATTLWRSMCCNLGSPIPPDTLVASGSCSERRDNAFITSSAQQGFRARAKCRSANKTFLSKGCASLSHASTQAFQKFMVHFSQYQCMGICPDSRSSTWLLTARFKKLWCLMWISVTNEGSCKHFTTCGVARTQPVKRAGGFLCQALF